MSLRPLLDVVASSTGLEQVYASLAKGSSVLFVGASGFQRALLIAELHRQLRRQGYRCTIVITENAYKSEILLGNLSGLLPDDDLELFPTADVMPHEEITQSPELACKRLRAEEIAFSLRRGLIVAPAPALVQRLVPARVFSENTLKLGVGQQVSLDELRHRLLVAGYEDADKVESRGHFCIKGGIVDVYPMTEDEPWRIEFFDDEIDSIRTFDPDSQRSTAEVEECTITPAREAILPSERIPEVCRTLAELCHLQSRRLQAIGEGSRVPALRQRVESHIERLQNQGYFPGAEQYLPCFYSKEGLGTLLDYAGCSGTNGGLQDGRSGQVAIVFDEPDRCADRYEKYRSELIERHVRLLEKGSILPAEADLFGEWEELVSAATRHTFACFTALSLSPKDLAPAQVVNVRSRSPEVFHGQIDLLKKQLRLWQKETYKVLILSGKPEKADSLAEALRLEDINAIRVDSIDGQLKPGNVVITTGDLDGGFEVPEGRLVVLTDREIFGKQSRRAKTKHVLPESERSRPVDGYTDLREGDYVVHVNHGIGQYLGVKTLEVGGVHKEYLMVRYAGGDKLYVPTDQVDCLQRYIGVEDAPPRLNKLGGNEWNRIKQRVKENVRELARELLQLYAERETVKGHRFSPDTVWQEEFEDAFAFEETPDQQRAVAEIKRDMERERPMDRLLCGDVGYGKTEVAIRAAFKAVMDSKQVAILVPTTILAQQHERTLKERFDGYPIVIRTLSRFDTAAEQKATIEGLRRGTVDIVIGTHRLLSRDVQFHDLGLVIIDEEQRFGVAQKERLKKLRTTVDVLTMTATPIPRTLHMALAGVRDMSVIETPPEDRFPVRTYVMEYDEDTIREAILRELAREGQVYFVVNRVRGIDYMAARLMKLVPEVRLGVAHGQMDESRLEQVMLDFVNRQYDILLCTTIIETGMDIPNVNTLIVYDADRFGLAQLYQLRGRVGRSSRVAYAYFTYRQDKMLTEDAEKRLEAIKEFTELGSGFKIAMRDLEIRGAGNILGPEQHGFISSVGFHLYCRLLDEAVRKLQGKVVQEVPSPTIDLNVDAYLSDDYIGDSKQKVEVYKRIVAIRSVDELDELREELADRFGPLPQSAENLLSISRIKVLARQVGVRTISSERGAIVVNFLEGVRLPQETVLSLTRRYRGKVIFRPGRVSRMQMHTRGLDDQEVLEVLTDVLQALAEPAEAAV